MCKYCNFNVPVHYLINDAPIDQENTLPLADATITDISVTESQTLNYQFPNSEFANLQGQRQYQAALENGAETPDWIEINSNSGELKIKPTAQEIGNYEVIVTATDSLGEVASSIVALEVVGQAGENSLLVDEETTETIDRETEISYDNFITQGITTLPEISINDLQVTDSSVGRELTFKISLDTASNQTVQVNYSTADDTAVAGEDYLAVNGTISFAPGEKEKTVTVQTTGTSYLDPDESFFLNLSNANNATIGNGQGEGKIIPAYGGIRGGSRKQDVVTFSFFNEDVYGQGGYDGSDRESNAKEPSDVVKANYRQIFDHLNTFVDREFVEVEETESTIGNIRIVVSDGPSYAYAGGHIHLAGWAAASDAGGNGWESPQGAYAYAALMHELGHAIGMPHSFGKDSSVFDPEENASNTVMSYTYPGNSPGTFMSYDIKSLQERYGAAAYRPEDTVYQFTTVDNYLVNGQIAIDTTRRLKQTIWDSGGIDTLDFSGLAVDAAGYRFDLNQSKYQTTQDAYRVSSYSRNGTTYYVPTYGTSIAIDAEIENLVNSSSDDLIIANSAANTFSGYGLDKTTGDDVLIGTDNLDTLDLSEFSFWDVAKTQIGQDLQLKFNLADSITIEDYFSTAEANRIEILLDSVEALISDVSIVEGNNGSQTANFNVNLSAASNETVELKYNTVDGDAKAGTDYLATNGTITFAPGETSKAIAVEILGDTIGEADETFGINLLGSYDRTIAAATGTIVNNDDATPLPTISIADTRVTDGNNAPEAIFTVSLERSQNTSVTVDYSTVDGLAVAGEDYTASNGTLTFAPGETEKTIAVEINGDSLSNRDENFKIELSNVSSNATILDGNATGKIIDPVLTTSLADGTNPQLALASYPPDGKKDPNNLAFAVSENHQQLTIQGNGNGWKEIPLGDYIPAGQKPLNPYSVIEFDFKSTDEGKLHGIHFEGKDHHAFYAPWERGRFFQLYGNSEFGIQDFNNYEDSRDEWKTYQIPVHQYFDTNNWRNYGKWVVFAHEGSSDDSNTQFRNLQIKELLPISVAGVTTSEAAGVASFTLTIPEASPETITLDYATADDTAVAGQDYVAASGKVTFAPGETSKTINVTVNDDNQSETAEEFKLNLSNVKNAIAVDSDLTANIIDNDAPLPVITPENVSVEESNAGTNQARLTVSLDRAFDQPITVDYTTDDNTATSESDYQAASGKVTFNPGETTKNIEVEINGDRFNEQNESFYLNLDNAVNATLNNAQAEVNIVNDDALPSLKIEDAGVLSSIPVRDSKGNINNSTGLLFKVSLDAASNQTIKVNYATADGTAKAGEDYSAKNKTLTFQPGETEKQVFVGVTLDDTIEVDENLYLYLTNPENVVIADDQAVGTIEETRSLSIADLEVSEDGAEAIFTVSLDKPSVQGVFVDYTTVDGTAKAGSDYAKSTGRLFIKAGEANATVAVPLVNNNLTEDDENFFLKLSKPKYVLIDDEQGEATITNDDPIPTVNPGGIYDGLQLWLKPDAGIATNKNGVALWADNSQRQLDVAQTNAENQPTLNSQGLNNNPILSFDGNDLLETIDTLPADFAQDSSVFVVTKSNSRSNNFLFTLDNTGSGRFLAHMPWSNQIYFDAGGTGKGRLSIPYYNSEATEFSTWNFQSQTNVGQNIFRNGLSVAADNNTQSPITKNRQFQLGRQYKGDIAEVIVFNQALSTGDRLAVDSYLGIKYGFSLDQTQPTNYVATDGTVIWNAATAGDYNHDIAGITINRASGLNQIQSRSSNQDSIVTIKNPNNLANGEALVWSNNNGAISANSLSATNNLFRQWQVQEIGDVGTVDLSFDLSQIGQILPLEDYALQISSNESFDKGKFYTNGRKLEGDTLTFTGINLKDGEYFTLDAQASDRTITPIYLDYRLNAGGQNFVSSEQQQWNKGYGFSGVNTFISANAIANTADDALYQSEYFGHNFSYQQALADGNYDVTLKFAEVYFDQPGKRVFDVKLEDQLALDDFDLVATAGGKNIALDRTFNVRVEDGSLDLDFIASVDKAKISAIAITPAPDQDKIKINAGNSVFDSQGQQWGKGAGFSGANSYVSKNAIANTTDDALYQSEYFGRDFDYQLEVDNGNYDVTLKFAEVYFNQPGQRVFDVKIEDQLALDDFDLVATAGGKNIALDRTFNVRVEDGSLDLDFIASVDKAKISAIEITPAPDKDDIKINAGNSVFDFQGQQWIKGAGFSGANSYVSKNAIANTTDDALYQSEYFGRNFSYQQALANGKYDVTLKFAEVYFDQPGQRVFDVKLEDQLVLDDFDLVAEAGGKNIALDRTFGIDVNDGILNLDFIASIDRAKISGIEIEPISEV